MTGNNLFLKQVQMGPMENFVYFIGDIEARECMVVDPAWDIPGIKRIVEENDMTLKGALITHYHPDHCGGHIWGHDIPGVAELLDSEDIPVYANRDELEGVATMTRVSKSQFHSCDPGAKINVGKITIEAIHTPGHTPGSQCFLVDGKLVAGDTLFIQGCGRVDLPGGNAEQLFHSLKHCLGKMPNETVLYPGHNYDTQSFATIGDIKKLNHVFKADTPEQFRSMMGG